MSGVVNDYYANKAESRAYSIVFALIIVVILTPIYLGYEIRELLRDCSFKSEGRTEFECHKMKILGYSVAIIYLIFVGIMHVQKYIKDKAFDDHIKEKKKTNDELKVIEDENKRFSEKVHIISIPFYIFLVIMAIIIFFGLLADSK